jgi:hypothetical protein
MLIRPVSVQDVQGDRPAAAPAKAKTVPVVRPAAASGALVRHRLETASVTER